MGQYTEEQIHRINEIMNETPKEFQRRINGGTAKMEKTKRSLRDRFYDYSLPDIIMWVCGIVPATGAAAYFGISALPGVSPDTAQSLLDTANMAIPVIGVGIIGGVGYKFRSLFMKSIGSKTENAAVTSSLKDGWDALYARRDLLVLEWSKYETDISLMIDYPIMTDYTDPEIRKVITAMQGIRKAEMATPDRESTDPHTSALQDAVDEFEVSLRAAERYARRYGQTRLDPKEQQKLSTARTALNIILDEEAPSSEVAAAYKTLRSSLKGIIDVPVQALAAVEARVRNEITVA